MLILYVQIDLDNLNCWEHKQIDIGTKYEKYGAKRNEAAIHFPLSTLTFLGTSRMNRRSDIRGEALRYQIANNIFRFQL